MVSQCTCPYCNRSFELNDDVLFVAEVPEQKIACYCTRCDYRWNSIVDIPKRCPNCGSYHWREFSRDLDCKRCGYQWVSRKDVSPLRCPKCRSLHWNTPRVREELAPDPTSKQVKAQYCDRVDIAIKRCSEGEGLYDVCLELDVAVLDIAKAVLDKGIQYRV